MMPYILFGSIRIPQHMFRKAYTKPLKIFKILTLPTIKRVQRPTFSHGSFFVTFLDVLIHCIRLYKFNFKRLGLSSFCLTQEPLLHIISGYIVYLQQGRYAWCQNSIILSIARRRDVPRQFRLEGFQKRFVRGTSVILSGGHERNEH